MPVIGVRRWVFRLPGCRSLKMKRSVIRRLLERAIRKFRVSAAETGHLDSTSSAEVTACVVSGDRRQAESVLGRVDSFMQSDPRAQVVESEVELL